MENLTSISEHSDWLEIQQCLDRIDKWNLHRKRVNLGKKPLSIEIFVPCKLVDGVWVVLEEPEYQAEWEKGEVANIGLSEKSIEYQESKESCLFEGLEVETANNLVNCYEYKTIEDLVNYNLKLTDTAKKMILS